MPPRRAGRSSPGGVRVVDVVIINIALLLFSFIPSRRSTARIYGFLSPRQRSSRPVLEQYGFLFLILVAFLPLFGGTSLFQQSSSGSGTDQLPRPEPETI
jgi:uncharacterized membrane protein